MAVMPEMVVTLKAEQREAVRKSSGAATICCACWNDIEYYGSRYVHMLTGAALCQDCAPMGSIMESGNPWLYYTDG
jgi:hypothetical protein